MEIPVHSRAATALLEIFESGRFWPTCAPRKRVGSPIFCATRGGSCAPRKPLPVWTWSLTEGLSSDERRARTAGHDLGNAAEARAQDPREVLDFIATHSDPAIFHLKDFHEPMRGLCGRPPPPS